jgi:hypothetical protein
MACAIKLLLACIACVLLKVSAALARSTTASFDDGGRERFQGTRA